jgi:hypothetical protein
MKDSRWLDELDERDLQVARHIGSMSDLAPPPDLLASIMGSLAPKKQCLWRRIFLWARFPRSITVIPLRFIPAASVLAVLLVLGLLWTSGKIGQRSLPVSEPELLAVSLRLEIPDARSVSVIGTFNNWKPEGYEMKRNKDQQVWTITLRLPQGRHEYAFLVDHGRVVLDPGALFSQDDGFGNQNSVLILRGENGQNA